MMNKLLTSLLAVAIVTSTISLTSCKQKMSDADIKTNVETALRADPMSAGTMVAVNDGVATITGQCKDDMCKASCEKTVAGVKGVKSVVNNCMVMPPMAPPVITADDPLTQSVNDALTAFPGVTATVNDGTVTLMGQVAKADRQKLMMAVQALKPKKVDASGLTNK